MENVHKFPRPIDHTGDLELVEGKKVKKERLINILNYLNFQNRTLLINLKHIQYSHSLSRQLKPLPCIGEELLCVWADPDGLHQELNSYQYQNILVPDGQRILLVKAELIRINEQEVCFNLPEECCVVSSRKAKRHPCEGIRVQLFQSSVSFNGVLVEFSPFAFCVEIHAEPPQSFQWIDPERPANVILSDKNETYYSGACSILRQTAARDTRNYILTPLNSQIQRFKAKEFRSFRQELIPLPNIIFTHPFTKKTENRKVLNISGSGFAVAEDVDNAVLLPGMIIPELEINFASSFKVACKAQVVYQKESAPEEEKNLIKCGLALLDMDIEEHRKLQALLHQATDSNLYLGSKLNMDALWNFFFESGFIYPQKYAFIEANKDDIRATYEKLYTMNPTIARHFIYQDKDRILGHMAMIRFFENSWLIHHHAATREGSNRAGLAVLNQVGRFINDSQRLYSIHLNYVFCYYRPENKFPDRVFGSICRSIKDPKGCSVDTFAYFHYHKSDHVVSGNEDGWTLEKTDPQDLEELKRFYEDFSGGLMLSALELEPDAMNLDHLTKEFKRLGFKRERYLFSLKKNSRLKAVFMANISDVGLNLSELTSCIQVIILDPADVSGKVLYGILSQIAQNFEAEEIPILVFPGTYVQNQLLPYEKSYNLWAMSTHYSDFYFRQLKRLLRYIQS